MNINEKSWHCRLHDFAFDKYSRPRSLCPYFWKVVFALFGMTSLIVLLSIAFTLVGWELAAGWLAKIGITSVWAIGASGFTIGAVGILSLVGVVFGTLFGLAKLKDLIEDKIKERNYEKYIQELEARKDPNYVPPKKSILMEFIRARKEKFCPSLTFTEE
ncbi:membrane protein [Citrobacter phage Merlin]|uniref:Uncharacterized protein n=1 Tax=Citrobacter phage Merlin TaxID=1675602 RepID=A0A0K1LNL8_9CAUD|nr:membrane protein [Citrobacter phage Merlin]AKU43750.1 hypothetical protein CPT_Merlin104 [Citrobacter phage Merlin]